MACRPSGPRSSPRGAQRILRHRPYHESDLQSALVDRYVQQRDPVLNRLQDETEHHQPRAKRTERPGREMIYLTLNVRNERRQNGAEGADRQAGDKAELQPLRSFMGKQAADQSAQNIADGAVKRA